MPTELQLPTVAVKMYFDSNRGLPVIDRGCTDTRLKGGERSVSDACELPKLNMLRLTESVSGSG